MKLHLFEFEDQPWFPSFLRDYQTDFLGFISELSRLYLPAERALSAFEDLSPGTIIDLASGNGRAALVATDRLRQVGWRLLLSDKFPNQGMLAKTNTLQNVAYLHQSVDALKDFPKAEIYTTFNAFHHFSDAEKLQIGKSVVKNGGKLLVFEPLQPTFLTFFKVLFATTFGLLVSAPFIKPFSIVRLILTYVLPIGILVTCWDGLVSVLRAPSRKDIQSLAARGKLEGLNISFDYLPSTMATLTHIRIE